MPDAALPLEIDCTTLRSRLGEAAPPVLLDCRERDEWELVHIKGAELLPMSEIVASVNQLEPHREANVVVYCHHGMRSAQVAAWLRQQGFGGAQSLRGGIDRWSQEIDPSLPRY